MGLYNKFYETFVNKVTISPATIPIGAKIITSSFKHGTIERTNPNCIEVITPDGKEQFTESARYAVCAVPAANLYITFNSLPESMSALNTGVSRGVADIHFTLEDPYLESVLHSAQIHTQRVRSKSQLDALGRWLHQTFPYRMGEDEDQGGVGIEVASGTNLCRHLAAMEYACLISDGIDAKLVKTAEHMFVTADVAGRYYVADPTWDFAVQGRKKMSFLRKQGRPTIHHTDYKAVVFVPTVWLDISKVLSRNDERAQDAADRIFELDRTA